MPINVNLKRFNKICELNYKANPMKSMTCGQYITACQQELVRSVASEFAGIPNVELLREYGSYLPESLIGRSRKHVVDWSAFHKVITNLKYDGVSGIALMCAAAVREDQAQ